METTDKIPFCNPFKCTPLLVFIVLTVIFLILGLSWEPVRKQYTSQPNYIWNSIYTAFFVGLSIYLLCCMGQTRWAWILVFLPLIILLFIFAFVFVVFAAGMTLANYNTIITGGPQSI